MALFLRAGTSNVSRRPRLAWAQSRTFERCAPATPQHDPPRALAPPRRAHCPCTAHISALDRIHGRTVWGGCTSGGLACGSLAIHTHHLDPAQIGGPLRPPSLTLTPPSAGLDDFEAKSAEGQARVGHRVLRRGLLPGVPGAHQFHRKSLRRTAPSKPTSNSLILASFWFLLAPLISPSPRRKLARHQSYQSRTGGFVSGRYRYAPRPDPFGWALAQPRRSQLLARRRAARDSLKGSRRSRAPRPPSFRQLSHRARLFACTFSLAVSRSLGRCLGRLVS